MNFPFRAPARSYAPEAADTPYRRAQQEWDARMGMASALASCVRTTNIDGMLNAHLSSKSFRQAFGSWWQIIAVILAAVPVLSWLSAQFEIGLSGFVQSFVSGYRALFYPPLQFLFAPLFSILPEKFAGVTKDGLVIWIFVGGTVSRTVNAKQERTFTEFAKVLHRLHGESIFWSRIKMRWSQIVCVVFWPLFIKEIFQVPFGWSGPAGVPDHIVWSAKDPSLAGAYKRDLDLRVAWFIQILAVSCVVLMAIGVSMSDINKR